MAGGRTSTASQLIRTSGRTTHVESWRTIPGHEGQYEVSDQGRVRSLPHRVRVVPHGVEATRLSPGRVLKPGTKPSGHVSVALGKRNSRDVHRLVCLAFKGPCPDGLEVLHLNHDPSDNRLENLRYGTRSENLKMDYDRGARHTHKNFVGSRWRGKNHVVS